MSLPVCPECKGLGFLPPSWQVKAQRHVAPECPACGGSGVDPKLIEAADEWTEETPK